MSNMFVGPRYARNIFGHRAPVWDDTHPRWKNQFYVRFVPEGSALTDIMGQVGLPPLSQTELDNLTLKAIDIEAPKMQIATETYNMYNKKRVVPMQVQYQPVSINIHDIASAKTQNLLTAVYNYYYRDGVNKNPQQYRNQVPTNIVTDDGSIVDGAADKSFTEFGYSLAGKINHANLWNRVELYLIQARKATRIDLVNPYVTAMMHDTFSQDSHNELARITFTLEYEAVNYVTINEKIGGPYTSALNSVFNVAHGGPTGVSSGVLGGGGSFLGPGGPLGGFLNALGGLSTGLNILSGIAGIVGANKQVTVLNRVSRAVTNASAITNVFNVAAGGRNMSNVGGSANGFFGFGSLVAHTASQVTGNNSLRAGLSQGQAISTRLAVGQKQLSNHFDAQENARQNSGKEGGPFNNTVLDFDTFNETRGR